ncbi:MAG: hypothetical protein FJW20_10870 [Acidimicrobiia bacterium]|nr:hypothetical protein [Acidimicrobiia bacterium]
MVNCLRLLTPALLAMLWGCSSPESSLQRQFSKTNTGRLQLPAGTMEISEPLFVPVGATDLEITGDNTVLRASAEFQGRAMILIRSARKVRLHGFSIEGNRATFSKVTEIPPAEAPFVTHFQGNGIIADDVDGLEMSNIQLREIPGFAVLVSASQNVTIEKVTVEDSGSSNSKSRNNTSGGILLEEGVQNFTVRDCTLRKVLGNGIWTHSTYRSPRNYTGQITGNRFEMIGRDAIQVGHANRIRVENNTGHMIGYPEKTVDVEGGGIPVGIDTAGKVDESVYARNRFEEINGKCIDLDGFHDGEVAENVCINRGAAADYPQGHFAVVFNNTNQEMQSQNITVRDNVFDGTKFGGIFVIGSGHRITGNKLTNINRAKCNESAATYGCKHFEKEPDLMQAGIYLGLRAERHHPANNTLIEGNQVSGHKMRERCVMAARDPSVHSNTIRNNVCTDAP